MMKALQLVQDKAGSKPVISLVKIPKPKPIPGHVLVRIHAAAINPSDRMNISGAFPYTTYPRVPGRDFAGVIEEGPADRIGEEVIGTSGKVLGFTEDGSYAEYCLVPEGATVKKPQNLSFAEAVRIGVPYTTAAIALHRATTSQSDIVLVLGAAGTVGSAAVQLAKDLGCRVVTASRHDDEDINTLKDPTLEGVNVLTNGHGVDVVIDTVGDLSLTTAAFGKLALRGRLSFITAPRVGTRLFSLDLLNAYRKEQELIGCNSLVYSPVESAAYLSPMIAKFESGILATGAEKSLKKSSLEEALEILVGAAVGKSEKTVIIIG